MLTQLLVIVFVCTGNKPHNRQHRFEESEFFSTLWCDI